MREKPLERKGMTRREFVGKAFFPAVAFGLLSICLGKLLPDRRRERVKKPNTSLKEASHYSKLAG